MRDKIVAALVAFGHPVLLAKSEAALALKAQKPDLFGAVPAYRLVLLLCSVEFLLGRFGSHLRRVNRRFLIGSDFFGQLRLPR